ncbi:MAG: hypothetical protein ABI992_05940, partial [Chthoniobacterales bacterium]
MKKNSTLKSAFFNVRTLIALSLCAIAAFIGMLGLGLFTGSSARAEGKAADKPQAESEKKPVGMVSGASYYHDVSPTLRSMPPWPVRPREFEREANLNPKIPHQHVDVPDPVVQNSHASILAQLEPNIPAPIRNF